MSWEIKVNDFSTDTTLVQAQCGGNLSPSLPPSSRPDDNAARCSDAQPLAATPWERIDIGSFEAPEVVPTSGNIESGNEMAQCDESGWHSHI